jgi:large subunit ribosomal protein L25
MTDSKLILTAENRTAFGKKTKRLRKEGFLPANIFGQDFESLAITVKALDFQKIYKTAGETGVVYIEVGDKSIPTLLGDLQYHPSLGMILHADFRKVNLKKKIEAHVPFAFVGESDAVAHKNGVLITNLDEVTVEALPNDIPHEIEIDIAKLKEIGDQIKVSDLGTSDKYTVQDDPESVIVSVTEHKEESIEPETVSEAPEITTEVAPEGEGAEAPAADAEEKAPKEE